MNRITIILLFVITLGCQKTVEDTLQCDHVLVSRVTSSNGAQFFNQGDLFTLKYTSPGVCFVDVHVEYRFFCGLHLLRDADGNEVIQLRDLELLANSHYDNIEIPAVGVDKIEVKVFVNDERIPSHQKTHAP